MTGVQRRDHVAVLIRPLGTSDGPSMVRLMLDAGFPPDVELPPDAAGMAHVLDKPLLVDDRGGPVAELAIAVEPEARGAGVGAALLEALARGAAASGHRELSLSVSPRSHPTARAVGTRIHARSSAEARL